MCASVPLCLCTRVCVRVRASVRVCVPVYRQVPHSRALAGEEQKDDGTDWLRPSDEGS